MRCSPLRSAFRVMFCPHQEFCCVILLLAVLVASHVVLPAGFLGCWLHYCWGCDPLGSHPGCVLATAGFGRHYCRRLLGVAPVRSPLVGVGVGGLPFPDWLLQCFLQHTKITVPQCVPYQQPFLPASGLCCMLLWRGVHVVLCVVACWRPGLLSPILLGLRPLGFALWLRRGPPPVLCPWGYFTGGIMATCDHLHVAFFAGRLPSAWRALRVGAARRRTACGPHVG